jgi:hypothetical protein
MDSITLVIGLGLGMFVLLARKHPQLLHATINTAGELPPHVDRLLAVLALIAYLTIWATDLPNVYNFLARIPWMIVPLCFIAYWATQQGAKKMVRKLLTALLLTSLWKIGSSFVDACTGIYRSNCPVSKTFQPNLTNEEKLTVWRIKGVHHFMSDVSRETTFTLSKRDTLLLARPLRTDLFVTSHGDTTKYRWIEDSEFPHGYRYVRRPGIDTTTFSVLIGSAEQKKQWVTKYYTAHSSHRANNTVAPAVPSEKTTEKETKGPQYIVYYPNEATQDPPWVRMMQNDEKSIALEKRGTECIATTRHNYRILAHNIIGKVIWKVDGDGTMYKDGDEPRFAFHHPGTFRIGASIEDHPDLSTNELIEVTPGNC